MPLIDDLGLVDDFLFTEAIIYLLTLVLPFLFLHAPALLSTAENECSSDVSTNSRVLVSVMTFAPSIKTVARVCWLDVHCCIELHFLLLHKDVEEGHGTVYTAFCGEVETRNFFKATLKLISTNAACSLDEYVVNIAAKYIGLLNTSSSTHPIKKLA